ncbi:pre-mRNA cleavage and polyadenylation factor (CPF) complex subunit [Claviceps citrina]|nr:pre-mRNA cleavage and polyadenylation factor (CPF) complex subunit [Claviceps citrina]
MAYEPRGDHGGGGQDGAFLKVRGRRPVTDYSSTVLHWLRHRVPNYKGSYTGERERPSASYIVDVS